MTINVRILRMTMIIIAIIVDGEMLEKKQV